MIHPVMLKCSPVLKFLRKQELWLSSRQRKNSSVPVPNLKGKIYKVSSVKSRHQYISLKKKEFSKLWFFGRNRSHMKA